MGSSGVGAGNINGVLLTSDQLLVILNSDQLLVIVYFNDLAIFF